MGRHSPMRTAKFTSPMTFTDTTPNWRRRWPTGIPIRNSQTKLPAPDAAHIDMHKIRSYVVADTASMQRQGSIPQLCDRNPGYPNIDRHCLHVETVAGDSVSMSAEEFVAPGRSVPADYINL